jgi:glycosyltransferase involved in cell wall biosynthesis
MARPAGGPGSGGRRYRSALGGARAWTTILRCINLVQPLNEKSSANKQTDFASANRIRQGPPWVERCALRVLLNAVSAKMGGAANYIRNIAPELEALAPEDEFICLLPEKQVDAVRGLAKNLRAVGSPISNASYLRRLWFDQVTLRRMLRSERIDVLYSTANLGMLACPCRQVLLVRNMLYFSHSYQQFVVTKGLKRRVENAMRRWLVCRSAKSADSVLTPSQAMLDALLVWCPAVRAKAAVNRYGVRHPTTRSIADKPLPRKGSAVTLLYTSLYGEHKNLGTLLRALLELVRSGTDCHLVTTADPNWQQARWTSTWKEDAQLAALPELIRRVEFKTVCKIEEIAELYVGANIFVYPSVIESFGHPLLEAMAVGLPIVAADSPVNRELCRDAAIYFRPFDPSDFAQQIRRVSEDRQLGLCLVNNGLKRSRDFRWQKHVEILLDSFGRLSTQTAVPQGPQP